MPSRLSSGEVPPATDAELAADLTDLGYVGFGHLRRKRPRRKNPADVLLSALNAPQREARVVEALPWLLLAYPEMNWNDVTRFAKVFDLQTRLGSGAIPGAATGITSGAPDSGSGKGSSPLLHPV